MKLVHWPFIGGLYNPPMNGQCTNCPAQYVTLHTGRGRSPPRPLLAVPNVTAQQSTAGVGLLITVLLYDGPLLCGFNYVPIYKALIKLRSPFPTPNM